MTAPARPTDSLRDLPRFCGSGSTALSPRLMGVLLTGRVRNDAGSATGRQNSLVTSRITSPIPYRPLNNEAWSRQPTGEAETSYGRLRFATVTVYGGYRPAAPVRVG